MSGQALKRWHSNRFVAFFESVSTPRRPVLTGVVFLATAAALVTQLVDPSLLEQFRRDGTAIDAGQWWRLGTGMFFQDGGIFGGLFNLVALAVVGTLAERYFGRMRWFVLYFGCGLFGQFLSYLWLQPVGAGNSMCVAGLLGALAIAVLRAPARHGVELHQQLLVPALLVAPLGVLDTVLHDNHGMPLLLGMALGYVLSGFGTGRAAAVPQPSGESLRG